MHILADKSLEIASHHVASDSCNISQVMSHFLDKNISVSSLCGFALTLKQSQSSTRARPGVRGRGAETNCSMRVSGIASAFCPAAGSSRLLPAYFSCTHRPNELPTYPGCSMDTMRDSKVKFHAKLIF